MKIQIATAPDSWGIWFPNNPKQIPWDRFLDEVARAGYTWIETGPYGYLPTDPAKLRSELEKRSLKIMGGGVMTNLEDPEGWPALEREVLQTGDLLAALGAQFFLLIDATYSDLFTGKQLAPQRLEDAAWKRLIDTCHRVGDLARQRFGLTLVFHPHAETHVEYEEQIETFLEQTDPGRVALCLDTGHHAYRGGDPVAFMQRHHARIPYLHVKSVDREKQRQVEMEKIPFAKAVELGVFCEPSEGAVDFLAFRNALQKVGYEGFTVVEQDMYPAPFDKPFPIAQRTRSYLQKIGF